MQLVYTQMTLLFNWLLIFFTIWFKINPDSKLTWECESLSEVFYLSRDELFTSGWMGWQMKASSEKHQFQRAFTHTNTHLL